MIEYLAIPASGGALRSLSEWVDRLSANGHPPEVRRDGADAAWIEVNALRFRGYALIEAGQVAAINFELGGIDPAPALRVIESAASDLGWEVHPDDPDDPDEDGDE